MNLQDLSTRLKESLISKGYASKNSHSGVKVSELARYINLTPQMTIKFVKGDAIPSAKIAIRISEFLEISPSWLMFGVFPEIDDANIWKIKKQYVHYMLSIIFDNLLDITPEDSSKLTKFVYSLFNDIAHLETDEVTTKKLIKIAISSASCFRKNNKTNE